MDLSALSDWRREFALRAEISREQQQRLAREMRAKEDKREEKEKKDEKEAREWFIAALATETQIAAFTAKLDDYDSATVEALMENEVELTAVRERIEGMLVKAHTLPDGRRVFLTEDGKQVFDEHGAEVKPEEVKPQEIDPSRPRWEAFRGAQREKERLIEERDELHDYQKKLDHARERADDPKLSKDELDALDKELGQEMPERVRRKVEAEPNGPAASAESTPSNESHPAQAARRAALAPAQP